MGDDTIQKVVDHPENISLPNLIAFLTGFIYVSGYLIHSIFVRNRGIGNLELIKAQYVETGLVFACITGFLVVVPYITTSMALQARREAHQPLSAFFWVNPFVSINYLYMMLFFAFFITRPEWILHFSFWGISGSIQSWATFYFVSLFLLLIITPAIRHLDLSDKTLRFPKISKSVDTTATSRFFFVLVNVLRFISVLLTIIFDYIVWTRLQWMPAFAARAIYFILCLIIVVVSTLIVIYWSRPYGQVGLRNRILLISLPFFLAFYLFTITTYTYGMYKNIPMSRGGKYPVTQAKIRFKSSEALTQLGLVEQSFGEISTAKLVYVIEESDDFFYVLPTDGVDWFNDTGTILAIRKSDVISIEYQPLVTGAPRIKPPT